jgi:hypothetical protein
VVEHSLRLVVELCGLWSNYVACGRTMWLVIELCRLVACGLWSDFVDGLVIKLCRFVACCGNRIELCRFEIYASYVLNYVQICVS